MSRLLLLLVLGLAACDDDKTDATGAAGATSAPSSVTQTIGPAGGTIEVGGATVSFPAGSVAQDTSITIKATDEAPPAGFVALSKVFECGPSGLSFSAPVIMTMPFTDDGKGAHMFWSSGADPAFKQLDDGGLDGARMKAGVLHFSKGFVGRAQ